MTWKPTAAPRFEPWAHSSDPGVTVIPVAALKQGKPRINDVIKLATFQWDELKNTGEYKRVQLHGSPYTDTGYPPHMHADVAPNPDVVDIYL